MMGRKTCGADLVAIDYSREFWRIGFYGFEDLRFRNERKLMREKS